LWNGDGRHPHNPSEAGTGIPSTTREVGSEYTGEMHTGMLVELEN